MPRLVHRYVGAAERVDVPPCGHEQFHGAGCLTTEQGLGRIAADADTDLLAPTLIGAAHLLFADRTGAPPEAEAVARVVTTVIGGVLAEPQPR